MGLINNFSLHAFHIFYRCRQSPVPEDVRRFYPMQFRFEELRYRLYELFLKRERASKIKELQENEAKPTYRAFHVQKIKGQLSHFLSFSVNLRLFETP